MKRKENEMFNKCALPEDPPSVVPRLREITSELFRDPMTRVFKTVGGKDSIVRSLLVRDSCGVIDAGIPEGEIFAEHFHTEPIVEHLMVYQGRAVVMCVDSGEMKEIGPGEIITLKNKTRHIVEAMKGYGDVRLIGLTVPRDPGYPGSLDEE